MKLLFFFTIIICIGCGHNFNIEKTENQFQEFARIELGKILGNLNCQSSILKKDSIFEGKADRHFITEYSFQKIIGDSMVFQYEIRHNPPTSIPASIDTGEIKLKCVNFQSPAIEEVKELVDAVLDSNLILNVWGNPDTIEALPFFTESNRSLGKYTILNQLKEQLSNQEIKDLEYNNLYHSSQKLEDLDLDFFKNKNVIWLSQQEAEDTGFYLKIYTPLFNLNHSLCFLRYDLACNRIADCSRTIYVIFRKEKNGWKRIHIGS